MTTTALAEPVLREAIAENIAASHSPKTLVTYAEHWGHFEKWAHERGIEPALPVAPETIERFITERERSGRAAATVKLDVAALSYYHREASVEDTTKDRDVRKCLKGIVNRHASKPKRQA